jgi:hypothetical protein
MGRSVGPDRSCLPDQATKRASTLPAATRLTPIRCHRPRPTPARTPSTTNGLVGGCTKPSWLERRAYAVSFTVPQRHLHAGIRLTAQYSARTVDGINNGGVFVRQPVSWRHKLSPATSTAAGGAVTPTRRGPGAATTSANGIKRRRRTFVGQLHNNAHGFLLPQRNPTPRSTLRWGHTARFAGPDINGLSGQIGRAGKQQNRRRQQGDRLCRHRRRSFTTRSTIRSA